MSSKKKQQKAHRKAVRAERREIKATKRMLASVPDLSTSSSRSSKLADLVKQQLLAGEFVYPRISHDTIINGHHRILALMDIAPTELPFTVDFKVKITDN